VAVLSALLMIRRLAAALRVALREQDFARVLAAALLLVVIGTVTYTLGNGWSVGDGFYVAVATLTTSSILDPSLTITDGWLKIFTASTSSSGSGSWSRSSGGSAWGSSWPGRSSRRPRRRRRGAAPEPPATGPRGSRSRSRPGTGHTR
jgi:hypothetical protein